VGRIAVVGSNMMDLVTYVTRMPGPGETLEAPGFLMAYGGKGANQAVAAAHLGNVGDDAFGALTRENFRRHGIDARHLGVVADCASGVAPIFVEPSGENRILIVPGANARLAPACCCCSWKFRSTPSTHRSRSASRAAFRCSSIPHQPRRSSTCRASPASRS
jgi:hypothetical protein